MKNRTTSMRYDICLRNKEGRRVITEIKNRAEKDTLNQLKHCMTEKNVRGMIFCNKASRELMALARKEPNIEVFTVER